MGFIMGSWDNSGINNGIHGIIIGTNNIVNQWTNEIHMG